MKNWLFYIALTGCLTAEAQNFSGFDTVKVKEVVISGKKSPSGIPGYKSLSADSADMQFSALGSVAELLSVISPVIIKSYGMGGIATPSFRGAGTANTKVLWNGFSIENPMLGQSDLSLLPAGLSDGLTLRYGGASMEQVSGSTGGTISLETKPVWNDGLQASATAGYGSFDRWSGLFSARAGAGNFQSVTKAFFLTAENDFRFMNSVYGAEPFKDTRKNNQISQTGILQEFYIKKKENLLSASFWYQDEWRNLPGSLLQPAEGQNERQHDESIRSIVGYSREGSFADFHFTGAWFRARLDYFNYVASIDSRNLSNSWKLKGEMTRNINGFADLKLTIDESADAITTNNYAENTLRNTASIAMTLKTDGNGVLGGSVLVREILDNRQFLIPDYSAALQLKLGGQGKYFLKTNFSRSSRLPSLNDLFWNPGGNPALKNEYSHILEAGLTGQIKITSAIGMSFELTVFRNQIHDMIKWYPGQFSYWTAGNIGNVLSRGLEGSVRLMMNRNSLKSEIRIGYSLTKAGEYHRGAKPGRQLMYVPLNQATAGLRISCGMLYSQWHSELSGARFTSSDGGDYLPAYFINDLSCGLIKQFTWGKADFSISVDNIFNTEYQTIAYYPLPGRMFSIKSIFHFLKKQL